MSHTVEELTRQLGATIQQDERYLAYTESKKANEENEDLQNQIKELNLIRIRYNAEISKSMEERDKDKINALSQEFNQIHKAVSGNETMMAYNAAKAEVESMMSRISGILTLCANGEDPATCEPAADCGGDCSGCAGCG